MAQVSLYSMIMEVMSFVFGITLIIIGTIMYSPIDDGAFFYIIVVGGVVLALGGLTLFIIDIMRYQKYKKKNVIPIEMEKSLE